MSVPGPLTKLFQEIDKNRKKYIENLREAVAIQSVSAWPHKRDEIRRMVEWTQALMTKLKIRTELRELGKQTLPDGKIINLPPALFGTLGTDAKKPTVLVYGHLDVQPALLEDGWNSQPFCADREFW
jgi:nonspecific dipeptidase